MATTIHIHVALLTDVAAAVTAAQAVDATADIWVEVEPTPDISNAAYDQPRKPPIGRRSRG